MIIVCGSCPKGTGGTVGQEKQPEKSLRNIKTDNLNSQANKPEKETAHI